MKRRRCHCLLQLRATVKNGSRVRSDDEEQIVVAK